MGEIVVSLEWIKLIIIKLEKWIIVSSHELGRDYIRQELWWISGDFKKCK